MLFCMLSLAQWLAYWCSVNECMLQIGKKERKKERNKDALKVVFNIAGQKVSSFVFSCALVGGVIVRVGRRLFRIDWPLGLHT